MIRRTKRLTPSQVRCLAGGVASRVAAHAAVGTIDADDVALLDLLARHIGKNVSADVVLELSIEGDGGAQADDGDAS